MEFKEAGNAAFRESQWSKAFGLYSKALESDPKLTAARANRAACALHLQQFETALSDCEIALQDESTASTLRVKLWWRKAVALRFLGRDKQRWESAIASGFKLDPQNPKLKEESQYVFVSTTVPSKYQASTPHQHQSEDPAWKPSQQQQQQSQDFLPSLPLTYSGVLRLARSESETTYAFFYANIDGDALYTALAQSGVEPAVLDYLFRMIATHPNEKEKNKQYMEALKRVPRYDMALFMADAGLHEQAVAATGN